MKINFSSNFHPLNLATISGFFCNNYEYIVYLMVIFYFLLYLFIEIYCKEELSFLLIYLYLYGLYLILWAKIQY